MIIDFHAHVYPDKIAEKAVKSIGDFYKIPIHCSCSGTPDNLISLGDEAGIDRFVIFSAAQTASQVASINDYISGVAAAHPERFTGFGSVHADYDANEIERIQALGLKGVKLHPDFQSFNIDDDRMLPMYARMEGKLPVIIHAGDYRYQWSHPRRVARVCDMFPRLTVIAAHFGGWSLWDLAREFLENKRCYVDVSSSIMFLGNRRAKELIRVYGAERVLFGTDYPMWNPKEELERLYALNLTSREMELILAANAIRLLKL
ncbi:MAG: amidohydrolase family protein [Clostridiales bacterium]|jgi:predicted TIM-barrel fold metal-dependent hydrolase|nr:amidohydrolase family protein [Clostridiales bacterium]